MKNLLTALVLGLVLFSGLNASNIQKRNDVNYQNPPAEKVLHVVYTNWRGETQKRSIIPVEVIWGSTEWHPEEQWLLKCWDMDRNDYRLYALKDIKEIL